jgi:uncharacterized membrane protein YccC
LPSKPLVFVNAYVGEENAGGTEEAEVVLPEWVNVLLAVAVGVAVAFCAAELVAFAEGEEALRAAEGDGAGVKDAWPRER